jgi:hypothetical protein
MMPMMDQQQRPETKSEGSPPPKPKPAGPVRRPADDETKHGGGAHHADKHEDKGHDKHHEGH